MAFTITVFVLGLIFLPEFVQRSRASEYVETAIAAHRNYLNGDLPMEIRSGSPTEVTAWFAGQVPFDFQLPAAQAAPNGTPIYRLTGGRLVNYKIAMGHWSLTRCQVRKSAYWWSQANMRG